MHLVFVYGSLKRNFHNNFLISNDKNNKFIGIGLTKPKYCLVNLGSFPGLLPGPCKVEGEVYEVNDDTFKKLDILESNGDFYQRELIEININNQTIKAWAYSLLDHDYTEKEINEIYGNYINKVLYWEDTKVRVKQ